MGRFKVYLQQESKVDKETLDKLRNEQRERREQEDKIIPDDDIIDVPPWLVGVFERYLAFLLVALGGDAKAVGTVLIAWIAAKLAANWQRQPGRGSELQDQIVRAHTLIALMTGTLSVLIGASAGWMARAGYLCLSS